MLTIAKSNLAILINRDKTNNSKKFEKLDFIKKLLLKTLWIQRTITSGTCKKESYIFTSHAGLKVLNCAGPHCILQALG